MKTMEIWYHSVRKLTFYVLTTPSWRLNECILQRVVENMTLRTLALYRANLVAETKRLALHVNFGI